MVAKKHAQGAGGRESYDAQEEARSGGCVCEKQEMIL